MRTIVVAVAVALASSGCITYTAHKRKEREPVETRTALTVLGVEVGLATLVVGLPISRCDEACPPGAGDGSVGEVAASIAWGVGFVLLADMLLSFVIRIDGMPQ